MLYDYFTQAIIHQFRFPLLLMVHLLPRLCLHPFLNPLFSPFLRLLFHPYLSLFPYPHFLLSLAKLLHSSLAFCLPSASIVLNI